MLAFRPPVLNAAVRLVNTPHLAATLLDAAAVMTWQRQRAGGNEVRVGGVSVLQRAGGSLNLNPHLHLRVTVPVFTLVTVPVFTFTFFAQRSRRRQLAWCGASSDRRPSRGFFLAWARQSQASRPSSGRCESEHRYRLRYSLSCLG